MTDLPNCPKCNSAFTYEDGSQFICPECAHEWRKDEPGATAEATKVVRDAVGNELKDGDTVTVIKDLKVKGSSTTLKVGTKISRIRLVAGDHQVDCKVDGRGILLKAEFLRKA